MRGAIYAGLFLIAIIFLLASSCVVNPLAQTPESTMIPPTALSTIPPQTDGRSTVIDHTNWDWYNTQPQGVIDNVAALKVFFAHASIGTNIMQGFYRLHNANSLKYPLTQESSGATTPGATLKGIIYEYPRGNPEWSEKISSFEDYVDDGWSYPKIGVAMNKLCAVDQEADWSVYANAISKLEGDYPTTKFVYFTIPYSVNADDQPKNVKRNIFNQNLRDWIAGQTGKFLFDIADIQAYDKTGKHITFVDSGTTYERAWDGYISDGWVHLNSLGSDTMATGLYSLFGKHNAN